MGEHDDKINSIKKEVKQRIDDSLITEVLIPNWDPIPLDEGFKWLIGTIYEGYEVKFNITIQNKKNIVNFLFWEFGEEEPNF